MPLERTYTGSLKGLFFLSFFKRCAIRIKYRTFHFPVFLIVTISSTVAAGLKHIVPLTGLSWWVARFGSNDPRILLKKATVVGSQTIGLRPFYSNLSEDGLPAKVEQATLPTNALHPKWFTEYRNRCQLWDTREGTCWNLLPSWFNFLLLSKNETPNDSWRFPP